MKKLLLVPALVFAFASSQAQVTIAPNFTANDCIGNPHELYADLDAGKVIVMAFVMPCGACSAPTTTAYNKVQEYASTNPGKVFLYVMDDYGNTDCTSFTNWSQWIGAGVTSISDASVVITDYGAAGMPKIVVVGGAGHGVFFNKNGSASNDATGIGNAIDQALLSTGVLSINNVVSDLTINTNATKATLNYNLIQPTDVNVTIYNALGSRLLTALNQHQTTGAHQADIELNNLSNGIYFVKFNTTSGSQTLKVTVAR